MTLRPRRPVGATRKLIYLNYLNVEGKICIFNVTFDSCGIAIIGDNFCDKSLKYSIVLLISVVSSFCDSCNLIFSCVTHIVKFGCDVSENIDHVIIFNFKVLDLLTFVSLFLIDKSGFLEDVEDLILTFFLDSSDLLLFNHFVDISDVLKS